MKLWMAMGLLVMGSTWAQAGTMVVTANFAARGDVQVDNLTDASSDGPGSPVIDYNSDNGDVVSLTAFPNAGFVFSGWTGNVPPGQAAANPATFTTDGANANITAVFEPEPVAAGITLTIDFETGYPGLGVGTVTVSNVTQGTTGPYNPATLYTAGDVLILTAVPGMVGPYQSYVFEWGGDIPEALVEAARPHPVAINITMDESKEITLLFSREYLVGDGVGDLDNDGLPDVWEIQYELDPKSAAGADGKVGNPDGDFMPWNSWPIPPSLVEVGGYSADRRPFTNFLEARGFDGLWGTADDPGTNPTEADTDGDGLSDGWEYYFWGLRGAGSATPLAWVRIDPLDSGTAFEDDDNDQLTNGEEYTLGTDPTHADTDRDAMDDHWENLMGLNPLDPEDAALNPDGDLMAYDGLRYHLEVYLAGASEMTAGATAFDPHTVLPLGPNTAFYTSFDEYLGGDRAPQKIWDIDGLVTDPFHSLDATHPLLEDTDSDGIPDGWELYVGMDPNDDLMPGAADSDNDRLLDLYEWANQTMALSRDLLGEWTNKLLPTDPGVVDRVFAWQNVWYDDADDGIYDAGVDTPIWDGGHPAGWTTLDQTVGVSEPLRPSRVYGIDDAPIVYDAVNNSAWADLDGDGLYTPGVDIPSTVLPPTAGDTGTAGQLYFYHNDPHPADTDYDGLSDSSERGANSNPTTVDTDGDALPDGWEYYAGTDILVKDQNEDYDGDGLVNALEYWTGTVFEWNHIDPTWPDVPGVEYGEPRMLTRRPTTWDLGNSAGPGGAQIRTGLPYILPPDFASCPSFSVAAGQTADGAAAWQQYHTTIADEADSDRDGMDDYWEVFHALNPTKGGRDLMSPADPSGRRPDGSGATVGVWDADPTTVGVFEIGMGGVPFADAAAMIAALPTSNFLNVHEGPFNFGLELMDPDGDGLVNLDEYSYEWNGRPLHHTDPTPWGRTDPYGTDTGLGYHGFIFNRNYSFDNGLFGTWGFPINGAYPFLVELNEGFDTDNDGIGDLSEIAQLGAPLDTIGNTDPVNSMDPMKNRALRLDRSNEDFLRTFGAVAYLDPTTFFIQFTVEAWVWPDDLTPEDTYQIVAERTVPMPNQWGMFAKANFRLAIDSATQRPVFLYNGRGAFDTTLVMAGPARAVRSGEWTHLAGVYDGTHLKLYVNGVLANSTPSTMIPANGVPATAVNFVYPGTISIGAREIASAGAGLYSWLESTMFAPLEPSDFFDGWIDEVRIWNGPRTQNALEGGMRQKMSRTVVSANAELIHYFSFDDNPDVDKVWAGDADPVVPPNLDALQGAGLPLHKTIAMWDLAPQRSTVYSGSASDPYNYIVFAKDLTSHVAVAPPEDDYYHFSTTNDLGEVIIRTNELGEVVFPDNYKNSSNPYYLNYAMDLVYLNGAQADGDIFTEEAWMTGAALDDPDAIDSNGDGIPDWWYIEHGFDPYGASIALEDTDGDGLWNINEYRTGLDPNVRDTTGNGVMDGQSDFDGDGLSNLREQNETGSRVDIVDTDDDGLTDWEEEFGQRLPLGWVPFDPVPAADPDQVSSPIRSLDPAKRMSMVVDGASMLSVKDQDRHSLRSWTLQAWVWPESATEGIVIRREVSNKFVNATAINYEMGIKLDAGQLRPYARYVGLTTNGVPDEMLVDGTGVSEVAGGQQATTLLRPQEWSHLAAVYDADAQTLALYINGELSAYRTDAVEKWGIGIDEDVKYKGKTTVGGRWSGAVVADGFDGYLDDVVIISGALDQTAVQDYALRTSQFAAALSAASRMPGSDPVILSVADALKNEHMPNQMLVRFADGLGQSAVDTTLSGSGVARTKSFNIVPVHLIEITDGSSLTQKLAQVRALPGVLYAEPNYRIRLDVEPNDPQYPNQWALNNTGQSGGTPGADIGAPAAWDRTTGSGGALVAVIDTGVDYTHTDLAANMWSGRGYDFANDDDDPMDDHGHGTHVAGTIAAVGNNSAGIAGVAWKASIMALKFLGADGFGSTADAIEAVEYSWQQGARISNNSWGSYGYSQALFDAIRTAGNAGQLFVAAAGNDSLDTDVFPHYPSSYSLPNIISVAASTHTDARAFFSNYGQNSVHLAAPGENILSTLPGGLYGSNSGTSMAAPHVAGVAALLLSQNPGMGYEALIKVILSSVDPVTEWAGLTSTGGRLNAARAVGGSGSLVAYFSFDDGGETAEDFTQSQDWDNDWAHAGTFVGAAAFSGVEFFNSKVDSNDDGIPDWWYEVHGYDPLGSSIALDDDDGDGLNNYYEYLAGTHPKMQDSNMDGVLDGYADADGDGLTNLQEQEQGTHPLLTDTDDDGVSDSDELVAGTDPLSADSPEIQRAMRFDGLSRLKIGTERDIDVLDDWTVEAWVRADRDDETGIITRRVEHFPYAGMRWVDYELGVDGGIPYITYAFRSDGGGLMTERVDGLRSIGTNWTHLAAVRDSADNQLRLYVNGKRVAYKRPAIMPPYALIGVFESTIGGGDWVGGAAVDGFLGDIDAVRIWKYVRSGLEIQHARGILLPEFNMDGSPDTTSSPTRLFNFDDGGTTAQNSRYPSDWLSGWQHAAEIQGAVSFIVAPFPPHALDTDDDAVGDRDERTNDWMVERSESPLVYRAMSFDGTGHVFVDELVDNNETMIYALSNWTVEAWVRPTSMPTGLAPLVTRKTRGTGRTTFELGVVNDGGNLQPYARFQRADAGFDFVSITTDTNALKVGGAPTDWTHLAASYSNGVFSLYMDGGLIAVNSVMGAGPYVNGGGYVLLGATNFVGDLQEVRIWNEPRTQEEIMQEHRNVLLFTSALLENSLQGGLSYLGRETSTNEDGYVYDHSTVGMYADIPYLAGRSTHKFAIESWIKMEPGSLGGIVAERKIDLATNPNAPDWRVNHSLSITDEGFPQLTWQGQVTVYTPVEEDGPDSNAPPVVVRLDAEQEVVRRNVTSEVDIRDGEWHHIAVVGDSRQIRLYIDGELDRELGSYYTFIDREGESFEGYYFTYMPINSVLRVGDLTIEAIIDEVSFWNEDLTQAEIQRHRDYGISRPDIKAGLETIVPLPANAVDDGGPHQRLVSYVTFDGELDLPFIHDLANRLMDYRLLPLSSGSELLPNTHPPIHPDRVRVYERHLRGYFAALDGGEHVENYMERNDYGHAGLMLGNTKFLELNPADVAHLEQDSDGDGLPDWWELLHGLDPSSSEGIDGAWGDPDGDGLHNLAELQAGTNPRNFDTDANGLSDFDSRGPGAVKTWGEMYTDGDGMADDWEAKYPDALSPLVYDAHQDADGDGWSNYAEFMAGTNPTDVGEFPRPIMNVNFKYTGTKYQGPLTIHFYDSPAMDGAPKATATAGDSQSISMSSVGAVADTGKSASGELTVVPVVPGSVEIHASRITYIDQGDGVLRSIDVTPIRFGQIDYQSGAWNVNLAPSTFTPGASASASWSYYTGVSSYPFQGVLAVVGGHLREGDNWAFAFIDSDADGEWAPGEPAGLPQDYPIHVSWGEIPTVTFGLTDALPGYERFAWSAVPGSTMSTVTIRRTTSSGMPIVLTRVMDQRTYFHEGDYRYAGMLGLDPGASDGPGYQWFAGGTNGTFVFKWTAALNKPVIQSPSGPVLYAKNDFIWSMDTNALTARIQIRRGANGPIVYDTLIPAPFREQNGQYRYTLPLFAGDTPLTNGVYYWQVQAANPRKISPYSDPKSFAVNLTDGPGGAHSIAGTVNYFGSGPATNIIVQAFLSPGFSGTPEAQIVLTNTGPYKLLGLQPATYYVRAFIDQNPHKTVNYWESWGFVRDYIYGTDYEVKSIPVPGNKVGQTVVIRDRDTNNNGIPDAWEFATFGSLNGDPNLFDADSDGLMDWEELFVWGSNPYNADSNGDGLTDGYEVSLGLNPVKGDTDGDGYADALEVLLGSDPTNALSIPSSSILLSIVSVMPGVSQDLISYDFDPGVISISTNVTAYLSVTPTLGMPFMPVPDSNRSIYTTNWTTGPWVYTNTPPAHEMQFYRIDWKIKNN